MNGDDRLGFKQMSLHTDAKVITSTMSGAAVTGDWFAFQVISSQAAVAAMTAAGITGAARLTSAKALPHGAWVRGGTITSLRLSVKSTGHKIIAYERVVL